MSEPGNRRDHRGPQPVALPPPAIEGDPMDAVSGARDHRGEDASPPQPEPEPELSEAPGGVQVTPAPTTTEPGTGAGGDWKGAGGD
jgi:hypothetical protein